jgi:hypothetical protein
MALALDPTSRVWFRLYGPLEPFFDKSWQLPDFELVK